MLLSEIDAARNAAVASAVATTGFSETASRVLRVPSVEYRWHLTRPVTLSIPGTGYNVGDPIAFSGGGSSTVATAHVASVDGTGAITSIAVDSGGAGFYSVPTVTVERHRHQRANCGGLDFGGRDVQRRRCCLLSASGELRPALLPGQRRGVR